MIETRSGKVLTDSNTNTAESMQRQSQPATNNKKRKAQAFANEEYKENESNRIDKDTTPPPREPHDQESKPYEKTPGRDGPIRKTSSSCRPDIKPFKGPKGQKVRKTPWEKQDLYVCYDKGPNGSSTYDRAGFQLDYNKVADWMKPKAYNKSAMVNGMERHLERKRQEEDRMKEIFFEKGQAPTDPFCDGANYWKDRVSKDLNIPWHKIGVAEFEEWEKRGFKKAKRGEYENPSEEERERMMRMISGASLRK